MDTMLSKNQIELAYRMAYYYRHPERTNECEKAILNKAKMDNELIHFKALAINRDIYRRCKVAGVR